MNTKMSMACIIGIGLTVLSGFSQNQACILDYAKNGDMVKVRAELFNQATPMFLELNDCPGEKVVVFYGNNPLLGKEMLPIKRDEAFQKFEKLEREELQDTPARHCWHCPRYKITANFEGKLGIVPRAGWQKDPKTGKNQLEGFGFAGLVSRFRLILTGVSDVQAVENAYPQ